MTTATAKQRWLDTLRPFVRDHLPPAPSRVLEIGCEPGYHQTLFEHHELTTPLDAVVACTTLHHVGDLDHVLDRAAAALAPGGTLIVVEWAHEKFDETTAQWCFDRLPEGGEPGWLHTHREQWLASGQPWHAYLDAWARHERLHSGHAIVQALQDRFHTQLLTDAPYFFPDLYPTSETNERAAIHRGEIQATGIRYIGAKP